MFLNSMVLLCSFFICSDLQDHPKADNTIERPALSVEVVQVSDRSRFNYKIQFSSSSKHVQTLRIRNGVAVAFKDLRFVDLNADGYKDMMILGGTDKAGNKWYKTWIYNPKMKQYVWIGKAIE